MDVEEVHPIDIRYSILKKENEEFKLYTNKFTHSCLIGSAYVLVLHSAIQLMKIPAYS